MTEHTELTELRVGARGAIRPGATVKVSPTKKGRHNGFIGTVRRIVQTSLGVEVEVFGGPAMRVPSFRTFSPDRLKRTRLAPTHRTTTKETS